MKRSTILIYAILTLFLFTNQCTAQNVSEKVKQAFNKKFPNAQKISWDKENATEFEAEFTVNGKEASANFDASGNWKETEMTISENNLPSAVRQALNRDYNEAKIMHAFEITSTGETMYEIEVKVDEDQEMMEEDEENEEMEGEENEGEEMEEQENDIQELVFTKDGKMVKKKEMEENEGDEEDENREY